MNALALQARNDLPGWRHVRLPNPRHAEHDGADALREEQLEEPRDLHLVRGRALRHLVRDLAVELRRPVDTEALQVLWPGWLLVALERGTGVRVRPERLDENGVGDAGAQNIKQVPGDRSRQGRVPRVV